MTAPDRALVRRKLATIMRNLGDLATVARLDLSAYRADRFRQKGTERLLQETIEAAVDVNMHLARAAGVPAPNDYYGSFVLLGELGVVPPELAAALAPAAGLRNRLVHEYDDLDDAVVLAAVAEAGRLFPRYVAAVEAAVGRTGDALGGIEERA